jgi:mannose-1-phosphate guanylyltransferase
VDTVVLAVNYRKDQIEEYFMINDFGKEIIVNDEPDPLGTGGAVKFAEKHITGSFLVLNADIISSLNLDGMIRYHRGKKAVTTISLWPVENVSEFGVVDIEKDGKVIGFVEKPKPEDAPSDLINAGAYFLEPEILEYIETGRLVSMEKEIFPRIIQDTGRFFGFTFQGYWTDVGRIQSYLAVHQLLLNRLDQEYVTGVNLSNKGMLRQSCVGDNVVVGVDSILESTIVFDHVRIGSNVVLKNCVIGEHCEIGDRSSLRNTVVGDEEHVDENTVVENKMIWSKSVPKGYPEKQIGNVIGE